MYYPAATRKVITAYLDGKVPTPRLQALLNAEKPGIRYLDEFGDVQEVSQPVRVEMIAA